MSLINTVTGVLSWLTLVGHVFILFFLVSLIHKRARKFMIQTVRKYAMRASFLIALFGIVASLFYSWFAGYAPCALCWFQRIFLYPQAFLFAVGLWRKDHNVFVYSLPLTVVGGLIGIYHVFINLFPAAEICAATGISCTASYFTSFGYINLPVMSLTSFVFLLVFALVSRRRNF